MVQPLREIQPIFCKCQHRTVVIISRQTNPTRLGLPSSQLQMWTSKQFSHSVLTCSITGSASYTRPPPPKKKLTAKWNHSFSGLMSSKNCHNCPGLASLVCDWQRHQLWARCTAERKVDWWMFPVGICVNSLSVKACGMLRAVGGCRTTFFCLLGKQAKTRKDLMWSDPRG